jgi:hypothetical protein
VTERGWPKKVERERQELRWFLRDYAKLSWSPPVSVERWPSDDNTSPDAVLRNLRDGGLVGVELTSVYVSDKSVPRVHQAPMPPMTLDENLQRNGERYGAETIGNEIERYRKRLVAQVRRKLTKRYAPCDNLILGVFVAETYLALYFSGRSQWLEWSEQFRREVASILPFSEIVLFGLANEHVLGMRSAGAEWR